MHLFFDLDGTIVDSRQAIVLATQDVFLRQFGVPIPAPKIVEQMGVPVEASFQTIAGLTLSNDEVASAIADFRRTYLRIAPDHLVLFPGARKALQALAEKGHFLAIVTSKKTSSANNDIQQLGLAGLFVTIVGSDRTATHKPDPAPLELARRELGACKTEYMIGDADVDMKMARAAGVASIGVSWGSHDRTRLRAAGADQLADDFPHLADLLNI